MLQIACYSLFLEWVEKEIHLTCMGHYSYSASLCTQNNSSRRVPCCKGLHLDVSLGESKEQLMMHWLPFHITVFYLKII